MGHQGEALLRRPGLRAGDVHRCCLHLPREVLRASRRPGHHHRQREIQVPRGPLPAFLPWNGGLRNPRDHLQLHHEVRRRHQEGPVRQHRHVRRHHHVPRYCRPHAEGDHRPGSLHHQDQDHRSPREEVLRLGRRLHPGFPLHLPADVDLQAGVRRVRPIHCPPQVLLSAFQLPRKKNNILDPIATIFIYLSVGFSLPISKRIPTSPEEKQHTGSYRHHLHLLVSGVFPSFLFNHTSIAVWSTDIVQFHSTLFYIPSSTLTLSLFTKISSETFVRSLTVYWHRLRNIRIPWE